MKLTVAGLVVAGTMAIGVAGGTVSAQQPKSQWDGVYTAEQAKRGDQLYAQHCSSCHGADMAGGEMAPGLAGGEFSANWNDLSLGDLFERIRISMPQNAPGSLSRQQNADIVAYILSRAAVPPGSTELPSDKDALSTIKFLSSKPSAQLGAAPPPLAQVQVQVPGVVALTPDEMTFSTAGLALPGMAQANLVGDTTKPGPYTIRLRFPDGYKLAPHAHPDAREVTILSGTWLTGYGSAFDAAKLKELPAGSFYTEPANLPHFVQTKGAVLIQVSGTGPSARVFVNPADNPR